MYYWRNGCQKNISDLHQNESPSYIFSTFLFRQHLLQLLAASFNKDVERRILALENNRYRILLHYTTHTSCMEIPRRVTEHTGSTTPRRVTEHTGSTTPRRVTEHTGSTTPRRVTEHTGSTTPRRVTEHTGSTTRWVTSTGLKGSSATPRDSCATSIGADP